MKSVGEKWIVCISSSAFLRTFDDFSTELSFGTTEKVPSIDERAERAIAKGIKSAPRLRNLDADLMPLQR